MPEQRENLWQGQLRSARYEKAEGYDCFDRNVILLRHVGEGKRVLELGCSTGYITRRLLQQKCTVTCIENDSQAVIAARTTGATVLNRDLNSEDRFADLQPGFEVVLMADVLEHLVNPYEVLRQARGLLCDGGYIVACLPNVVHWLTRLQIALGRFNYQAVGTLDATHLRFFTPRSASCMVEDAGYRLLKFHPIIGGRLTGHLRPAWQLLAHLWPGLFAYQLLIRAALCP